MSSNQPLIDIVKRGGKRSSERFEASKLHASVLAACLFLQQEQAKALYREVAEQRLAVEMTAEVCEEHLQPLSVPANRARTVVAGAVFEIRPHAPVAAEGHRAAERALEVGEGLAIVMIELVAVVVVVGRKRIHGRECTWRGEECQQFGFRVRLAIHHTLPFVPLFTSA